MSFVKVSLHLISCLYIFVQMSSLLTFQGQRGLMERHCDRTIQKGALTMTECSLCFIMCMCSHNTAKSYVLYCAH